MIGKEISMPFDYKKEYKEYYLPPKKPGIIEIPEMNYVAVRGRGNPNDPDGEYKTAMNLLYGIAFTIKMSYKGPHKIDGYFSYVVPPLEGLWWQEGTDGIDYSRKADFQWISMIRLPDFVKKEDFDWAVEEAAAKKKTDFSKVKFMDSAGIGLILGRYKQVTNFGGEIKIVNVNERIKRILEMSGITKIVSVINLDDTEKTG